MFKLSWLPPRGRTRNHSYLDKQIPIDPNKAKPESKNADQGEAEKSGGLHPIQAFWKFWDSPNRRWNRRKSDPPKWTDKAVVLPVVGIVFLAGMQWKEMDDSGKQADKFIKPANPIEMHQNQIVLDNKQTLADNRKALADSLLENRMELAKLLRQNRDALKAQTTAANGELAAVQKQTEVSERPWLSVEVQAPNGLIFVNGEQPALKLRLSIKNVGKSIAKDVQTDAALFPRTASMPLPVALDAAENQQKLCDHPTIAPIGKFDVFPTDRPVERELDISATPSEIASRLITSADDKSRRFVGLYFVGCVSYHYGFGLEIHQTFFAYDLVGPRITSPDGKPLRLPLTAGFEIGVNVPQESMSMIQNIFGRSDAY